MNSDIFPDGLASKSAKRKWFTFIGMATFVSTLISIFIAITITNLADIKHEETKSFLNQNAGIIKASIHSHLDGIEYIAEGLVNNIVDSSLAPDDIQEILENTGAIYDGFVAIGAAF